MKAESCLLALCLHTCDTSKCASSWAKIFCILTCSATTSFFLETSLCAAWRIRMIKEKDKNQEWLNHLIGHISVMQGLVLFCVFIFPPGFLCGPKECPSCIAGVSEFGPFLLVSSVLTLLHMDHCA